MAYSTEVLADSPILYWRLGDASGTTAADSSGNSRPGTYVNTPLLAATGLLTGDADTAVTFRTAQSEYVTRADEAALDGYAAMTVECWVKMASQPSSGVFYDITTKVLPVGSTDSWVLEYENNAGTTRLNAAWTTSSGKHSVNYPVTLTTGTTFHVVSVWSGTQTLLYVNKVLVASSTAIGAEAVTAGPGALYLGSFGTGGDFTDATYDEFAIYGTALSSTRIGVHYDTGVGAGGTDATVTAVPMVSTARIVAPSVSGSGNATVTAPPILTTARVVEPALSAGSTVTAVPAVTTARMVAPPGFSAEVTAAPILTTARLAAPTVTAGGDATVVAAPMIVGANLQSPVMSAGSTVTAAPILTTARMVAPGSTVTVLAPPIVATARLVAPTTSPEPDVIASSARLALLGVGT